MKIILLQEMLPTALPLAEWSISLSILFVFCWFLWQKLNKKEDRITELTDKMAEQNIRLYEALERNTQAFNEIKYFMNANK
jgi:16S rRNA C1402 (ribose-2'-O) methylase RsmI